jgi:DNA-binding MarR family transcriptional regulator
MSIRKRISDLETFRHTRHVCLCEGLRSATRAIWQRYARHIEPSGLGVAQVSLLVRLYFTGPITLTKLAEVMETDRTTLTRNLDVLNRDGYVEIVMGEDKRARQISMTDAGFEILQRAVPLWIRAQQDVERELGSKTWSILLRGTRTVVETIGEGDKDGEHAPIRRKKVQRDSRSDARARR